MAITTTRSRLTTALKGVVFFVGSYMMCEYFSYKAAMTMFYSIMDYLMVYCDENDCGYDWDTQTDESYSTFDRESNMPSEEMTYLEFDFSCVMYFSGAAMLCIFFYFVV